MKKKAKILLITPNLKGIQDGVNRIQPSLGLMLIAPILEQHGHKVKIYDSALDGWNKRKVLDQKNKIVMIGQDENGISEIISDFSGRGGYIQKYGYTDSDYHTGAAGCSVTYTDSPSTTSATTYKVQIKANAASNSAGICASNSTSMITLMEIST